MINISNVKVYLKTCSGNVNMSSCMVFGAVRTKLSSLYIIYSYIKLTFLWTSKIDLSQVKYQILLFPHPCVVFYMY